MQFLKVLHTMLQFMNSWALSSWGTGYWTPYMELSLGSLFQKRKKKKANLEQIVLENQCLDAPFGSVEQDKKQDQHSLWPTALWSAV